MKEQVAVKPSCESCLFWDGKQSSYLGMCCHPQNYPSRVSFDHSCRLYIEQTPIWSMQSLLREQAHSTNE
ncbi:MAG TPA: hypothetical protein VGD69_00490 [Herpetosiphonaceae bacterium]